MPLNAFRRQVNHIRFALQTIAIISRKDHSRNFKSLFKKRTNPDVYAILNPFRFHCTPLNSEKNGQIVELWLRGSKIFMQ